MIFSKLQTFPSEISLTHTTTGLTVQLSNSSITTNGFGNGTSLEPGTEIGAGFDAVGGVTSFTIIN